MKDLIVDGFFIILFCFIVGYLLGKNDFLD